MDFEGRRISVTMSFGVAACTDDKPVELTTLLRLADDALYRAKHDGRNRVAFASAISALSSLDTADPAALQSK